MAVHKKFAKGGSVLGRGLDDIGNGRGLDALIETGDVQTQGSNTISEVPVNQIEPNPNQPRREFDAEALRELADSIRQIGIIQPITLRQTGSEQYQIIAGERRWRAAQLAGLTAVPAYVKTIRDEEVMEMALVENIQREDLNAIEIALAYQYLMEQNGLTQDKVADRVGKSRTAVANYLRLLRLPAQVQMALQNKRIDMGHARALLAIDSPSLQIKVFDEIQKHGYSVRKVEEITQQLKRGESVSTEGRELKPARQQLPEEFTMLRQRLSDFFNAKVQMTVSPKGKGKITINFSNEEELESIMNTLDHLQKK